MELISTETIDRYIDFLDEAEGLKSVPRTAWTASGRRESTAEHSWRLALLAAVTAGETPGVDPLRVLEMCLVHDIGERYTGDVSAALHPDPAKKHGEEREAARAIFARLPAAMARRFFALWEEYEKGATTEARLVKALDKAETILQHNVGANPPDFDYAFNLGYGREYFEDSDFLRRLRERLDAGTRAHLPKPEADRPEE